MTDIHHATPSQLAEHIAHAARQRRLGAGIAAVPQARLAPAPKAVVTEPIPVLRFWFSIMEEIEPVAEREVTCADIKRAVAAHFRVSVRDLISARRTANVILPRQIGIYLAKEMTSLSLPLIGWQFGRRDHTTVLHSVRKIAGLLNDSAVAEALKQIRRAIPAS